MKKSALRVMAAVLCIVMCAGYVSAFAAGGNEIGVTVSKGASRSNRECNVNEAYESSYFTEKYNGRTYKYDAAKLCDGDIETCWAEGESGGYGIDEWVELDFIKTYKVTEITFHLGDWHDSDRFKKSSRPSCLYVEFSDGSTAYIDFDDGMNAWTATLDTPVSCSWIRFTVDDVYKGKTKLTAIGEITAYYTR